jgi:ribose transport system permease protein
VKKSIFSILNIDLVGVVLATVALAIALAATAKGFLTTTSTLSILSTGAVYAMVGIAQLLVLAVGQFNLALGAIACCSAMGSMALLEATGTHLLLALLFGLFIGIAFGFIQGLLVAKSGINPFVVTLAMNSVYYGLATAVFRSTVFNRIPPELKAIHTDNVGGIPVAFFIIIAIAVLVWLLLQKTYIGRRLLATGASPSAAVIAGINAKNQILAAHTISGLIAAIAGLLITARLGAAQLSIGTEWMTLSFATAVLGGTLMSGGKVGVIGTIVGAVLFSMIKSGLVLWGISFYWTDTFLGLLLLVAFELDRARKKRGIKIG